MRESLKLHKLDLMGNFRVISVPANQGSLGCGADSGCRGTSTRINIIYWDQRTTLGIYHPPPVHDHLL